MRAAYLAFAAVLRGWRAQIDGPSRFRRGVRVVLTYTLAVLAITMLIGTGGAVATGAVVDNAVFGAVAGVAFLLMFAASLALGLSLLRRARAAARGVDAHRHHCGPWVGDPARRHRQPLGAPGVRRGSRLLRASVHRSRAPAGRGCRRNHRSGVHHRSASVGRQPLVMALATPLHHWVTTRHPPRCSRARRSGESHHHSRQPRECVSSVASSRTINTRTSGLFRHRTTLS